MSVPFIYINLIVSAKLAIRLPTVKILLFGTRFIQNIESTNIFFFSAFRAYFLFFAHIGVKGVGVNELFIANWNTACNF